MESNPRIQPIERATNRSWDSWLSFLDTIRATDLSHRDIAGKVFGELEGSMDQAAWWSQFITVAYEHHIGRRIPGQRSDGTFQLNLSRSTSLGYEDLMARWAEFAAGHREVQSLVAGEPRISGTDRRITWRVKARDGSSIVVTSEPKRNGAASIVVTQMGLPTPEEKDAVRERWAGVLADFLGRL